MGSCGPKRPFKTQNGIFGSFGLDSALSIGKGPNSFETEPLLGTSLSFPGGCACGLQSKQQQKRSFRGARSRPKSVFGLEVAPGVRGGPLQATTSFKSTTGS